MQVEGIPSLSYPELLMRAQTGGDPFGPEAVLATMSRPGPYGMTWGPVGAPGYGIAQSRGFSDDRVVIGFAGMGDAAFARMPPSAYGSGFNRSGRGRGLGYGPAFMMLPPDTTRWGFEPPEYAQPWGW